MDPVSILFIAYLQCNDAAEQTILPSGTVQECVMIYEELKQQTTGGDYAAFVEWRENNEPIFREHYEIPSILE
jgi:hypothetical protein